MQIMNSVMIVKASHCYKPQGKKSTMSTPLHVFMVGCLIKHRTHLHGMVLC